MRERALIKCLVGMPPEQWYRTLNRHVFFWVASERLDTLLNARAYHSRVTSVAVCKGMNSGQLVMKAKQRFVC
jgi:hypothetical protein